MRRLLEMRADFSIFVRMDRGEIIIYQTADALFVLLILCINGWVVRMKLCESYQARFMFDIDFINEKIICVIR